MPIRDIQSKGDLVDSSVINFNGNDPVVLKKGETIVDSIGQVGTEADWGKDVSLVRNSDILSGDTNLTDAFDPSKWTDLGKDIFY